MTKAVKKFKRWGALVNGSLYPLMWRTKSDAQDYARMSKKLMGGKWSIKRGTFTVQP